MSPQRTTQHKHNTNQQYTQHCNAFKLTSYYLVVFMIVLSCCVGVSEASTNSLSLTWDNDTLIVNDGIISSILDVDVQVVSALFSQDYQRVISIQESLVTLYSFSSLNSSWYREIDITISNVTSATMLSDKLALASDYRVDIFACTQDTSCTFEFAITYEHQLFGSILAFSQDVKLLMVGALDSESNGVVYIYKKCSSSSTWKGINRLVNPSNSVSLSQFLTNILLPQITTVVGNGIGGFGGDSDDATQASLLDPIGIAVDSSGNIFIADTANHRIRKFTPETGKISTIAGTGISGYNGDDILAESATLNMPTGVALDSFGNLFIADSQNHRIRMINSTGIISTIAGDGDASYTGDGLNATDSSLNNPTSVAVDTDSNIIYIADTNNLKIRKITSSKLYNVAGTNLRYSPYQLDNIIYEGNAKYIKITAPTSIAAKGGKVYFVESGINTVRQIVNGQMKTLAYGCNPNMSNRCEFACLDSPSGISIGPNGDVFVTEKYGSRIRRIDPTAKTISTIAGINEQGYNGDGESSVLSSLSSPTGIAIQSNGVVYFTDSGTNRIRKIL